MHTWQTGTQKTDVTQEKAALLYSTVSHRYQLRCWLFSHSCTQLLLMQTKHFQLLLVHVPKNVWPAKQEVVRKSNVLVTEINTDSNCHIKNVYKRDSIHVQRFVFVSESVLNSAVNKQGATSASSQIRTGLSQPLRKVNCVLLLCEKTTCDTGSMKSDRSSSHDWLLSDFLRKWMCWCK